MKKKNKKGPGFLRLDQKTKIYKRRRFYNKLLYLVFKHKNVITPATHIPTEQTVVPIRKLF